MKKVIVPLFIALAAIIGFVIGNVLTQRAQMNLPERTQIPSEGKIDALLNIINAQYVDSVNSHELVEEAIPKILAGLDPHSVYIPASDLQSVNEELEGSFSGIGVQFQYPERYYYDCRCSERRDRPRNWESCPETVS